MTSIPIVGVSDDPANIRIPERFEPNFVVRIIVWKNEDGAQSVMDIREFEATDALVLKDRFGFNARGRKIIENYTNWVEPKDGEYFTIDFPTAVQIEEEREEGLCEAWHATGGPEKAQRLHSTLAHASLNYAQARLGVEVVSVRDVHECSYSFRTVEAIIRWRDNVAIIHWHPRNKGWMKRLGGGSVIFNIEEDTK